MGGILAHDQEAAFAGIVDAVRLHGVRVLPEQRPVGSHERVAERAIQAVEEQSKVIKLALEFKLQVEIPMLAGQVCHRCPQQGRGRSRWLDGLGEGEGSQVHGRDGGVRG